MGEAAGRWADGPLAVLDTETTGVDVLNDRIVTATFGLLEPGGSSRIVLDAVVDPGVAIPAEAAAVHGISTERARAEGRPPAAVLAHLAGELGNAALRGVPVVIFNATYDWPLIHAEAGRHGVEMPEDLLLLDPLVIDRAYDRYRRGKRRLADLAAHYGVRAGTLHESRQDALLGGQVMRALAARHPSLAQAGIEELQVMQQGWFADWRDGMNAYLAGRGADTRVTGDWPWGPLARKGAA